MGQLDQVSAEIGGLKTAVELLTSRVESMSNQWATQETSAAEGRRKLHEKVEAVRQALGLDVASLSLRVDRLTDKVTVIEPSVKSFNDESLRAEGAKRLGKALIAALTAAAGIVGWAAHELIGRWFPH